MQPSDKDTEIPVRDRMKNKSCILNYNYDYKVAKCFYENAEFCITMKHHPIIFSYAGCVPVIAIALDPYYHRKNVGAMSLCNQDNYCMDYNEFMQSKALFKIDDRVSKLYLNRKKIKSWLKIAESEKHGIEAFLNNLY